MKFVAVCILVMLTGCSSMADPNAPYGEPISAERLYWPQKVDRVVTPSGNAYIIRRK